MKTYSFILIGLFMAQFSFGQVESGKVTYKAKINKETIDSIKNNTENYAKREGMRFVYEKVRRGLPGLQYDLVFNTTEARFKAREAMARDNGSDIDFAAIQTHSDGLYYTNLSTKTTLWQVESIWGETYRIKTNTNRYNWKITGETKVIKGYTCHKAKRVKQKGSRKFVTTAWFCPDLPFQYGPIGYSGLPGLILELNDRNLYVFYAETIKLNEKQKQLKKPTKGKLVSEEGFEKLAKDHLPPALREK